MHANFTSPAGHVTLVDDFLYTQETDVPYDEGLCTYCFHAPSNKDLVGRRINDLEDEPYMKSVSGDTDAPHKVDASCCIDQAVYPQYRDNDRWRDQPGANTDPDVLREKNREQGVPPLDGKNRYQTESEFFLSLIHI